jgi:hypothetical protein
MVQSSPGNQLILEMLTTMAHSLTGGHGAEISQEAHPLESAAQVEIGKNTAVQTK